MPLSDTASTPTAAPAPAPTRTGPVIALLVVAAFVVILNETTMSVALTDIVADLGITVATGQWLTTGFLLTMAVVIPLTGYLLERFTLRTVFFAAMTLFSAGTLIAALAPGFEFLLAGRIVQASGTAIMMPLLFTTVLNIVPPSHRGRMMGTITVVIAVAPAIGPTVSGLILSTLTWHAIFWVMLPISLIAIALGAVWVKNVTETRPDARFDVLSVPLSALGFGGLIYGFSAIGESASGHAPVPVAIPLVVGALALVLFVLRQLHLQKTDSALLDLRTFQTRAFSLAVVLVVVVFAALFGSIVLLPIYLQQVLGLDVLGIGLMLLPGGILMGAMAPFVGNAFDRVGPTPLVIPGMIIAAAALWGMTLFDANTGVPFVIAVHLALNLGLGLTFTPLLTSALGSLPRRYYPYGSATVGTLQQVAGAAGTALFVTIMTVTTAAGLADGHTEVLAKAGGVHAAFLVGAIVASAAVVLALFVRKPAEGSADEGAPLAH
ncbi:DHA2 family lincomycin resistance protein-like MFS transporter [Microbacterium sp. SORGH_AS 505]|uniref:MDR family MFS transporter n=1 Tax=Microbacterium sp. SORGH_AS_0505 TaxID=3041770 RepID=UPI00278375A9|nr:MDR family MFS transporter [Microbacterium sp. SORGH_AS_0505]MDQ1127707.1 DHA2 family lincomycin resistance protein-like MFS transporter [Microbacterium sp. SORGH_AS_0505]